MALADWYYLKDDILKGFHIARNDTSVDSEFFRYTGQTAPLLQLSDHSSTSSSGIGLELVTSQPRSDTLTTRLPGLNRSNAVRDHSTVAVALEKGALNVFIPPPTQRTLCSHSRGGRRKGIAWLMKRNDLNDRTILHVVGLSLEGENDRLRNNFV
ncbi:hypothetical protein TNCV_4820681 [Trichonephila clavipes]|nr:hypothetical protein TNCV_4820681 [Trichonephila clavipes]